MLVRDDFRGKSLVNSVIDLPFALPTIVAGLTLLTLYGPHSPVGIDVAFTRTAIVLALCFVTLPFVIRTVQPVLIELDVEMEEAARSLGAGQFTVFRRIVLPNILPGILSGSVLAFARALGEIGSIVLVAGSSLHTEVASVFIFNVIQDGESADAVGRRDRASGSSLRGAPRHRRLALLLHEARTCLGGSDCARWRSATCWSSCSRRSRMVFYRTFQHGLEPVWQALSDPNTIHAFKITLIAAAIAVPLNTVFGVLCALAIVRRRFRGKGLLNAFIDLPLAVSPVVIGLCLYLLYAPRGGWFGTWLYAHGFQVLFALPSIVLATIFVSVPFVAREVIPTLRELGNEQEQAAATLGATRWQRFWRITLPSIRWAVIYGVILTTARCLGEYGAVAVVSGRIVGKTETATTLIDDMIQNFQTSGAYAVAVVLAVIAVLVLVLMTLTKPKESI